MDELRSFFNNPCSSKTKVVKLRGSLTGGIYISKDNDINELDRKVEHRRAVLPSGTDYVREVRERENEMYLKNDIAHRQDESISAGLESLERLTSVGSTMNVVELTAEAMTEVYKKYSFQRKDDTNNLAINDFKQDILDAILGFPVVIIEGPTGCGKTTQVPQWILDDCYQNRKPCKVIVTQPRRIAAISISKRVAQERGWDIGSLVGYQVGLENRTSADSRITYVTTGILLQKLVASKTMNEYSHIILDEVHERGQEMDFLLLVVKKLLFTVSSNVKVSCLPSSRHLSAIVKKTLFFTSFVDPFKYLRVVKVILMSATFNSQMFAEYFSIPNPNHQCCNSACIKIEKRERMFTVKTFYLNDLNKFTIMDNCFPKPGEPGISVEMYHLVIKLLHAFEQIDSQEDNCEVDREEADLPSVLMFLPGINEIEDLYNCLIDITLRANLCGAECAKYNWWVLPLHSTITAEEQVRVFQKAPPGNRKIILSTNIAESSITVPDIKYVIDFCLMKTLIADEHTNFTSLQLTWASKTNCEQRAGRAGRVRDGRVYRLVTGNFYDTLKEEAVPEILRCPLERLVLLAKMLNMGPPSDILALAMDPPDMSNIRRTLLVLKEIGALKKTVDEEWSNSDGDITYLGRVMAKLPLDVKVSKMIMLGYIFGCLEETIIMAAAMSAKNVFSSPFRERLNAYNSKLTWADGTTSDCIAFYNVYKVWRHLRTQNYFKQQGNNESQWARRFYVQVRSLRETDDMVRELKTRLSREGIEAFKGPTPYNNNEISLALKVIIAGAFYPQYFVQVSTHEERERDAVKLLGGLDPRDTVYLQGFPDNQPGEVYTTAIKNLVRQNIGDEPRVTFDKNSKKVFLTFGDTVGQARRGGSGDPTIPGQVLLPVYKSIKARQLKIDIRIPLLPVDKAQELATMLEASRLELNDLENLVPRLPEVDDTHIPLRICWLISISKFWVQVDDESTDSELRQIQRALNGGPLMTHTGPVRPGDVFAAPHNDGARRVSVVKVLPRDMVQVLYMDWGEIGLVNVGNLRELPGGSGGICQTTPPLAMRCRLSGIAPAPLLDAHGAWSQDAGRKFHACIARGPLLAKVYSVVHGVVAVELLAEEGNLNVNQELLRSGLAVACDESYESKLNHDLRQSTNELNNAQKRAYNREQTESAYNQLKELDPPSAKECCSDVRLKGAFSPLETSVHTLMYGSREKTVNIEWNSVNSVLLDTDPQQTHQKLVVAAMVGQNETSSNLTLRHTTVMPNIPGLPAIIALLFCPSAELRRDAENTRYVSVLCGLGSDEDGTPYFPEHDLLVDIDADMDVDDIGWINHIRHLMDFMMQCGEGQDVPTPDDQTRPKIPKIIKGNLMKLLKKRRKYRECASAPNAWTWRSVAEEELLEITMPDIADESVVFPLHAPQELCPVPLERLRARKHANEELKLRVGRTPISSATTHICELCGTMPMPTQAMRIHLYSNAHLEKEEDLLVVQS